MVSKPCIYRQATPEDVQGIQHVLSTTWEVTYTYLKPETIAQVKSTWHSTEFLAKQIKNTAFYFPIALEKDRVVGIATSGMRVEGVIDLFRFYVLPEYQGRGIGTQLLKMVEQHYPKATKIQVYVDVLNDSGLKYYEGRGFKKVRLVQETSFDEALTEWVMEKHL